MALSRKQLGYGKGGAFGGGRASTTRRKQRSGRGTYKYVGTYKGSTRDAQNIESGRLGAVTKGAPPEVVRLKRQAAKQIGAFKQAQRVVSKFGKTVTGPLTEGQKIFINTVAKETGLSPRVIAAQVLAEQSGSAATQREAEGNHNWLNIGYFDSGPDPSITGDKGWSNPRTAGKLTAQFFKGKKFGASAGIKNIVNTRGQSDAAQINAIVNSGWASSGYGGTLQGTYSQVGVKNKNTKKLRQAKKTLLEQKKNLSRSGLDVAKVAGASRDSLKLKGPYDGSRAMVSQLLGQKVKGDKEAGHSPTGYHSVAGAYAQDIGSAGGNASEGEAGLGYNQQTLNKIVNNLRKKGAKVSDLELGDNWSGTVKGYDIELITKLHGSGYHIHLGAKWNGAPTSGGIVSGGSAGSTTGGATVVSAKAGVRNNRIISRDLSGEKLLAFVNSLNLSDTDNSIFDTNINPFALKQVSNQKTGKVSSVKVARKKGAALQIAKQGADKFGVIITSTTGGSHVPGSYHYSGRGVDVAGSAKQMRAFFNWASRYKPTELFYDPIGYYWKNGKKVKGSIGGHSDHVHIAL